MNGFRSITEFVRAVLLLPMRFWFQWTGSSPKAHGLPWNGRHVSCKAIFTDLDFADDVALLAEMLSVLILALKVMNEEAQPLGLTINWAKTKIQITDVTVPPGSTVQVGGSNVL